MFVPDQGKNKMDSKGYNIVFKLLIITVFVLAFIGYFIIYKTAEERHIRNFLEYEELQTRLVANNLEDEFNHILQQHLLAFKRRYPAGQLSAIFNEYPEMVAFGYVRQDSHLDIKDSTEAGLYDWVSELKISELFLINGFEPDKKDLQLSEFHFRNGTRFLFAFFPFESNATQSTAFILIDMDRIFQEVFSMMKLHENGASYLLEANGTTVYHYDKSKTGVNVFEVEGPPSLYEAHRKMVSTDSGTQRYRYSTIHSDEYVEKLVGWNTIHIAGKRFIIAMTTPTNEVTGELTYIRNWGIFFQALLLISLFLLYRLNLKYKNKLMLENAGKMQNAIKQKTTAF